MTPIKVMLADDHPHFLMGLATDLSRHDDIEIVYQAPNGLEVIKQLEAGIAVDILVLDLDMPMSGFDVLRRIEELSHPVRVIILSAHDEQFMLQWAIEYDISGYIYKGDPREKIYHAIRSVADNGNYFNAEGQLILMDTLRDQDPKVSLAKSKIEFTPREIEVIDMICQQMTTKQIAAQLYISPRTVEDIRSDLIKRVGARNVIGLVLYALRHSFQVRNAPRRLPVWMK